MWQLISNSGILIQLICSYAIAISAIWDAGLQITLSESDTEIELQVVSSAPAKKPKLFCNM